MNVWDQLVDCICRPPRDVYAPHELLGGANPSFMVGSMEVTRLDFELTNKAGQRIMCSHYLPLDAKPKDGRLPVVVYCHCNSGSRRDAEEAVWHLLPCGVGVVAFDFAGSGLSDGKWVTLGAHEVDDLAVVIAHLRSLGSVSSIGLWGRSMGAVTALLYSAGDPGIAGMVLDSPFSRLTDLMLEIVVSQRLPIPKVMLRLALKLMRSSVRRKAGADISAVSPLDVVGRAAIPAMFGHGQQDSFIDMSHSVKLHAAYNVLAAADGKPVYKNLVRFDGDHNHTRPAFFYSSVCCFFHQQLRLDDVLLGGNPADTQQLLRHGSLNLSAEAPEQVDRANGFIATPWDITQLPELTPEQQHAAAAALLSESDETTAAHAGGGAAAAAGGGAAGEAASPPRRLQAGRGGGGSPGGGLVGSAPCSQTDSSWLLDDGSSCSSEPLAPLTLQLQQQQQQPRSLFQGLAIPRPHGSSASGGGGRRPLQPQQAAVEPSEELFTVGSRGGATQLLAGQDGSSNSGSSNLGQQHHAATPAGNGHALPGSVGGAAAAGAGLLGGAGGQFMRLLRRPAPAGGSGTAGASGPLGGGAAVATGLHDGEAAAAAMQQQQQWVVQAQQPRRQAGAAAAAADAAAAAHGRGGVVQPGAAAAGWMPALADDDVDADLAAAIAASLQEQQAAQQPPAQQQCSSRPATAAEEEEMLRRAIELSLAESQEQQQQDVHAAGVGDSSTATAGAGAAAAAAGTPLS